MLKRKQEGARRPEMGSKMGNKRAQILDAMESLMIQDQARDATVSDIARRAGIGKGSIYYYFKSKSEIFDAVIERSYAHIVEQSWAVVQEPGRTALEKCKNLFTICVRPNVGAQQQMMTYLHIQDSLLLHQKFLTITVRELTPILTDIIRQGIAEGTVQCAQPEEAAEIIVSVLTFFLDHTLFPGTEENQQKKLRALSWILEKTLDAPPGSFAFLSEPPGEK